MIRRRLSYLIYFLIMRFSFFMPDWQLVMKTRGALASFVFKKTGYNFQLCSTSMVVNSSNIIVGNNVYFAHDTWLQGIGGIEIGDNVMLGPQTIISTSNHTFTDGGYRFGEGILSQVKIGDGSWTGAGTKIMPGVTIGKGVLCAAGSVVVMDVPDFAIVAGCPAKIIGYAKRQEE
jgi:acetyltransferase-like isoleucine patch superfamily enzyme